MKTFFKCLLLTSLIGSVAVAYASGANSSTIPLGSIKVLPHQTGKVSLASLQDQIIYNVSCTITDTTNIQNKTIMSFITDTCSGANKDFSLNGKDLGDICLGPFQVALPAQQVNTFVAQSVYNWNGNINFINTDDTDTIAVNNCVANPVV
ncbi:MAG: hypothetical protein K0R49_935 [Burkholderiales bacterium]|jgi:hypothetical protein|nr:hypothetical protein [Burkholderiales bacterium]